MLVLIVILCLWISTEILCAGQYTVESHKSEILGTRDFISKYGSSNYREVDIRINSLSKCDYDQFFLSIKRMLKETSQEDISFTHFNHMFL